MKSIIQKMESFLSNEVGVTSIEYALLASLIAMAIFGAVTTLGINLLALYEKVIAAFP